MVARKSTGGGRGKSRSMQVLLGEMGDYYTIILNILNQERNKGRRKVRKPKMQGMRGTFF